MITPDPATTGPDGAEQHRLALQVARAARALQLRGLLAGPDYAELHQAVGAWARHRNGTSRQQTWDGRSA